MAEETQNRKKVSVITEVILFLGIVLVSVLLFQKLELSHFISSLKDTDENVILDGSSDNDLVFENKAYVQNIKKEYGIMIYFAKEVEKETTRVEATPQYDVRIINNNLKAIETALKKYPKEVFDMSRSKKYPINILLVDQFQNDNLALASRNSLNEFKIFVSNTDKFERALHHEIYHVLEYYMSDTRRSLYATWNTLNPENFSYESDIARLDTQYVYSQKIEKLIDEKSITSNDKDTVTQKETNPYFVTKYAKVSEKEDRAELFAELMIAGSKPSYLEQGQHIRKKADKITDVISQNITRQSFIYSKFFK